MEKHSLAVYFIIATEFCMHYAFSGLRTLLSLYLRNAMLLSEATSTMLYHVFIMACFITPLLGAIVADACLANFSTILLFTLLSAAGHLLILAAAIPPVGIDLLTWTLGGLALVAVGAGGVKPCVAAFGGDQFHPTLHQSLLQAFFPLFFFAGNLGGLLGTLTTPLLRKSLACFGDEACYALAFGLPAAFAVVAVVIFLSGRPFYRVKAPRENVMCRFMGCFLYAGLKRLRHGKSKVFPHWLDHGTRKYDASLIHDMKAVFAILALFLPLPVFWSLIVQQGSRWTFQATRMDGNLLGVQVLPDHIQAVNPTIVLLLIPLFDKVFYPFCRKYGIMTNALERMTVGGIAAGLSFVCAGVVEYKLQETASPQAAANQANIVMLNTLPCDMQVQYEDGASWLLVNSQALIITDVHVENVTELDFTMLCGADCSDDLEDCFQHIQVIVEPGQTKTVVITAKGSELIPYELAREDLNKALSGRPKIRLIFIRDADDEEAAAVSLYDNAHLTHFYMVGNEAFALSNYTEFDSGHYTYYVTFNNNEGQEFQGFLQLKGGGVYSLVLRESTSSIVFTQNFALVPPNHMHILWLLPQYLSISIAEVLFAISGMEFCFSQAPRSMKTVMMAAWYLTVAAGNFLVILTTHINAFSSQGDEYLVFVVVAVLDVALFRWIAEKYRTHSSPDTPDSLRTIYQADNYHPPLAMPSHMSIH